MAFHCDCTNLHSHQQYMEVPFFHVLLPHPCQHLLFAACLVIAILTAVRWSSIMALTALPDDSWCWTCFHVSVSHSYVFFGKMSIQILCPVINQIACFFVVELYILNSVHQWQLLNTPTREVLFLCWWSPSLVSKLEALCPDDSCHESQRGWTLPFDPWQRPVLPSELHTCWDIWVERRWENLG